MSTKILTMIIVLFVTTGIVMSYVVFNNKNPSVDIKNTKNVSPLEQNHQPSIQKDKIILDTTSTTETVNKEVTLIEKSITNDELSFIELNDMTILEGKLPNCKFYYNNDGNLIAVFVEVGHETWYVQFSYFFSYDGTPIKFIKKITGRPDNPPLQAIIYNHNSKVLWKNIESPPIDPIQLQEYFSRFNTMRHKFSEY